MPIAKMGGHNKLKSPQINANKRKFVIVFMLGGIKRCGFNAFPCKFIMARQRLVDKYQRGRPGINKKENALKCRGALHERMHGLKGNTGCAE